LIVGASVLSNRKFFSYSSDFFDVLLLHGVIDIDDFRRTALDEDFANIPYGRGSAGFASSSGEDGGSSFAAAAGG
jgi:hypothetical protein